MALYIEGRSRRPSFEHEKRACADTIVAASVRRLHDESTSDVQPIILLAEMMTRLAWVSSMTRCWGRWNPLTRCKIEIDGMAKHDEVFVVGSIKTRYDKYKMSLSERKEVIENQLPSKAGKCHSKLCVENIIRRSLQFLQTSRW